MKHKIIFALITILLLTACVGCGNQSKNDDLPHNPPTVEDNNNRPETQKPSGNSSSENQKNENPQNGNDLLHNCKATGTVKTLFDNGCDILPTVVDGNVAMDPAQGYEDQWDKTTVKFNKDCVFQIASVNMRTGTVKYSSATVNDVKKNTRLVIYGDYDNSGVLCATHIYIYRNAE